MTAEDAFDLDWYVDNVVVPSDIELRKVGPVRAWQGWWTALEHRLRADADDGAVGEAVRLALGQGFVLTGPRLGPNGSTTRRPAGWFAEAPGHRAGTGRSRSARFRSARTST